MSSDLALLTRWANRREAEAFREIVSRYAPMVYATCVRVLGDPHEAEDVAQECFETLVRTAKGPDKHLGAWLHRVATNRSLDHVRSERQRKLREADFAEQHAPSAEQPWDDVYEHVDAAITELPEELRIPIVAYYLQGQRHAEIARSLKTSRRTVARRLAQGTELLAQNLRKRGVVVSAAALASFMTARLVHAAPISAALSAALGMLALSQLSVTTTGSAVGIGGATGSAAFTKALLGLVAAAVVVVAAIVIQRPGSEDGSNPNDMIESSRISTTVSEDNKRAGVVIDDSSGNPADAENEQSLVTVTGRVQDDLGSPVEGATVQFAHDPSKAAQTDVDGVFSLPGAVLGLRTSVTASAEGYGRGEVLVTITPRNKPISLVLPSRRGSIAGRVVDMAGRALPNIEVQLTPQPVEDKSWYDQEDPTSAKTDARGMFSVDGLRPGPYSAYLKNGQFTIDAITDPIVVKSGQHLENVSLMLSFAVDAGIEGIVTNEDGEPIAEVGVLGKGVLGFHSYKGETQNQSSAKTDKDGHYRLEGIVDPVHLLFTAPDKSGFAEAWMRNVAPGSTEVDAVLFPAGALRGRVKDAASGQPLTEFELRVFCMKDTNGVEYPDRWAANTEKKEDGRFVVEGIPLGSLTLWVRAQEHAAKLFRDVPITPDSGAQDLEVALGPPCVLEALFTLDGEPLKGYTASLEAHLDEPPRVLNQLMFNNMGEESVLRAQNLPEGMLLARGGIFVGAHPFIYRSSQQATVTLASGQTTRVEFNFTSRYGIRGYVTAPEGSARCAVVVYDPGQVPTQPCDCLIYGVAEYRLNGSGGEYEIRFLEPGEYLVTAYSSDARFDFRRAQSFPVTVTDGDIAEVDFDLVSGPTISGLPR